jgi:ABC-type polysaccharide/polyol phosphate transport system ATPase subunit
MIELRNVSKVYPMVSGSRTIFENVNLTIRPGERVGIVGRNGAGKSTLIRLISGAEKPTTGVVNRSMSVSWPLAFSGGFQPGLTGADNLRFICRIYGVDFRPRLEFVHKFSELGAYLNEPVAVYSSGMKARLAFAISMVIEFDCYLIDEVIAVGDEGFREKCEVELFQNRRDRAMIIVSHSFRYLRAHCNRFVLVNEGRMEEYDDAEEVRIAYKFRTQPTQAEASA